MKRRYIHCNMLEEAPMWGASNSSRLDEYSEKAMILLTEPDCFYDACLKVFSDWPNSSIQNLSARCKNRIAWLGQAACCVELGCVEYETRNAWRLISDEERDTANKVAQKAIEKWEKDNA